MNNYLAETSGICAGLAMVPALRNNPSDRDEALGLCQKLLGELQYEKIKTSLRTILFIIMKNSTTRDDNDTEFD